jgi:hypothetical protein
MTHGHARRGQHTAEYESWSAMHARVNATDAHRRRFYGSIKVCARWASFKNFLADMGPRPADCSLDRRKTTKNYTPSNCRWATRLQQARNQRSTVHLTLGTVTRPLTDWAERLNIPAARIHSRLRRGWTVTRALQEVRS